MTPRQPAAISCRFPARPTCPTACCARSTAPTIDHRGPEFQQLGQEVLDGHEAGVQDQAPRRDLPRVGHRRVGSGAREHALARRPRADVRDRPLRHAVARRWRSASGSSPSSSPATGATAPTPRRSKRSLREDQRARRSRRCAWCTTRPRPASRAASAKCARRSTARSIRRCFMVDTISSLASIDYRHDEWGVDVTVAGSQKGLMLPPGLSFNAVSDKALAASANRAKLPRSYWSWEEMLGREQERLLSLHAGHQSALRPARSAEDAARGRRPRQRVRAPRPPRRSDAPRGARLGPRDPVRRTRPSIRAR